MRLFSSLHGGGCIGKGLHFQYVVFPLWCTCSDKHSVQISTVMWRWWEGNCLLCSICICKSINAWQQQCCARAPPSCSVPSSETWPSECSAQLFSQHCLTNNLQLWENGSGLSMENNRVGERHEKKFGMNLVHLHAVFQGHIRSIVVFVAVCMPMNSHALAQSEQDFPCKGSLGMKNL